MPDEDKNFGGSLVLDFRKWWRHMKTIYSSEMSTRPVWTCDFTAFVVAITNLLHRVLCKSTLGTKLGQSLQ